MTDAQKIAGRILAGDGTNYTIEDGRRVAQELLAPIPMRLICPSCMSLHIDEGEFATKPHHTHACQHCGEVWRPAVVHTVGVRFLPGFKNEPAPTTCPEHGELCGGPTCCCADKHLAFPEVARG